MPAIHFSFSECRSYPGISAAWQYPDLPSSRIHQWPRRSRDTVKFLLFEPPSDNHGLGSMLEVIALRIMHCVYECRWLVVAAAFRKTICLMRGAADTHRNQS